LASIYLLKEVAFGLVSWLKNDYFTSSLIEVSSLELSLIAEDLIIIESTMTDQVIKILTEVPLPVLKMNNPFSKS